MFHPIYHKFQMSNSSRNINIYGGIDKLDPNISIPDTWASNSNRNIQDSQSEFGLKHFYIHSINDIEKNKIRISSKSFI